MIIFPRPAPLRRAKTRPNRAPRSAPAWDPGPVQACSGRLGAVLGGRARPPVFLSRRMVAPSAPPPGRPEPPGEGAGLRTRPAAAGPPPGTFFRPPAIPGHLQPSPAILRHPRHYSPEAGRARGGRLVPQFFQDLESLAGPRRMFLGLQGITENCSWPSIDVNRILESGLAGQAGSGKPGPRPKRAQPGQVEGRPRKAAAKGGGLWGVGAGLGRVRDGPGTCLAPRLPKGPGGTSATGARIPTAGNDWPFAAPAGRPQWRSGPGSEKTGSFSRPPWGRIAGRRRPPSPTGPFDRPAAAVGGRGLFGPGRPKTLYRATAPLPPPGEWGRRPSGERCPSAYWPSWPC
jgi:hypothetical protein